MNSTQLLDVALNYSSYSIGENFRSKFITAHPSTQSNIFYSCTCNVNHQNQIQVLEYNEEENKISLLRSYTRSGLYQKIIPSVQKEDSFFLLYSEFDGLKENRKIAYCDQQPRKGTQSLNESFEIENGKHIHTVLPNRNSQLTIVDNMSTNLYDINSQRFIQSLECQDATLAEMDPHHQNIILIANKQNQLIVHDLRESKISQATEAHKLAIYDIDFNPNKQYYAMTASEDGLVKFWDMKKFNLPVKTIDEFVNMPLCSKYNKYHDQLIITSFNDASVQLSRTTSVSTTPIDRQMSQMMGGRDEDGVVKVYDEHEDSIYSLSWSSASAWIFASVSYNANVIVNIVPSSEKFRILL